jgi:hypothetical protein
MLLGKNTDNANYRRPIFDRFLRKEEIKRLFRVKKEHRAMVLLLNSTQDAQNLMKNG